MYANCRLCAISYIHVRISYTQSSDHTLTCVFMYSDVRHLTPMVVIVHHTFSDVRAGRYMTCVLLYLDVHCHTVTCVFMYSDVRRLTSMVVIVHYTFSDVRTSMYENYCMIDQLGFIY